jgi:acetyl esterase
VTIAPEIKSLIDWGYAVNERHGALPLAELRIVLREEFDEEMRRRGAFVEPVADVTDHTVDVASGQIRVRMFTPSARGPHPAFLHMHGGGFVFGTVDSLFNDAKCAHICRAAECVVVTVDYRLAPEFVFPTAPEDCYSALAWMVDHASEFGLDSTRVAVGGESAGGNLAAVLALMVRDRDGPPLALQLLEVPVTDITSGAGAHASVALFGEGYGLDASDMDTFADAYLADRADGSHPYASPLLAANLVGVASAHVLTAELDVLRDSGEAYAERLKDAGVDTALRRFARHTHGSSGLWQVWEPARVWMDECVLALRRALHPEAA